MFEEYFKHMEDSLKAQNAPFMGNPKELAELLKKKFALLSKHNQFHPGDVVVWKIGFRNARFPREYEPVIVVDFLEGSLHSEEDSTSYFFRQPNDLCVMVLSDEGVLFEHWLDSRRFELFRSGEE